MDLEGLRGWIDSFLGAHEEERHQIALAQRRRPELGALYAANRKLFASERITEVQRALAASAGAEERRLRSVLEFLAGGRALAESGDALDELVSWKIFGSVVVGESRIPHRQIPGALRLAGDPERRHAIEEAHLATLDEQRHLVDAFLGRQKEGIAELGYGSHVDAMQILAGIDLRAVARDGEEFLARTRDMYDELLAWHLPRVAGAQVGEATLADALRLSAAPEFEPLLPGADRNRRIAETIGETGLDPAAEGRIEIDWEAYLGAATGAICWAPRVPEEVRLAVTARSGRMAVASFLREYGMGLHAAYTDPELPVEQRRLGDASVPMATGRLFESLLQVPAFVTRLYDIPKHRLEDYLGLAEVWRHFEIRRQIGRLHFEVAYYDGEGDDGTYAELLTNATGVRHDPREALWTVDPGFGSARRIRAAQLAAVLGDTLRQRFDDDWFRNPRSGGHLRDLFAPGRSYSAAELAIQMGVGRLGW
ncbi:MAG: hypothetical protein WD737_09170 [Gemmatimonadota bacterium]